MPRKSENRDSTRRESKLKIKLDQRSKTPAYHQVITKIRSQIASGYLKRGDRIPPVRQLCDDLGVSYATAARGIRALVEDGVLEARTGAGTHVAAARGKRLETIGVVGFVSFGQLMRDTHYFAHMLPLVQDTVIESGQTVVYDHWRSGTPLGNLFNNLELVDGLIVLGADEGQLEDIRAVRRMGVPVLTIGPRLGYDSDVSEVDSANVNDSRRAIEALLDMGHKHVAIAQDSSIETGQKRYMGAVEALRKADVYREALDFNMGNATDLSRAIVRAKPRPTAIFLLGMLAQVPNLYDQLSGTPCELGTHLYPALYDENLWHIVEPLGIDFLSIEQPMTQIARSAVEEIEKMIESPDYDPGRIRLPSRLVRITAGGYHEKI